MSLPFYNETATANAQFYVSVAQTTLSVMMGSSEDIVTRWPMIKLSVPKRFNSKVEAISQKEKIYLWRV